jgi:hypothetical protein
MTAFDEIPIDDLVWDLLAAQSGPRSDGLLSLVEEAIVELIDTEALDVVKEAEKSEQEIAQRIAATPVEQLVAASA